MARIQVIYRIAAAPGEIEERSRSIAYEQTVEVPPELVPEEIKERIVGRVETLEERSDGWDVTISYKEELAASHLPQLLNLIYGNISIHPDIRVADLKLPSTFLQRFSGPRYGIRGIRDLLQVHDRPLLATALKPRGSKPAELAKVAHDFALGGGDLVKDDHNLVEDKPDVFRDRVRQCRDAVAKATRKTGKVTLYLPYLSAPTEELEERIHFLLEEEIPGVLLCPFLLGLDLTRSLLARFPLVSMAHPSFSGSYYQSRNQGVSHGIMLGTLLRLAGCDISVFPNHGGRFSFTQDECLEIQKKLNEPLGGLAPAFPAPAGGMNFERLPSMGKDYGKDAVYLIGGALIGHSNDLCQSTQRFLVEIEKIFSNIGSGEQR